MVRFKNRWLLADVTFDPSALEIDDISKLPSSTSTLQRTIRNSLQINFGDVASGALGGGMVVKYYSSRTHTVIIRCSRLGIREIWGAITLCNEWEGKPIRIVVLHCGGTIRKVQEAAIRINRRRIEAFYTQRKQSRLSFQQSTDKEITRENDIDKKTKIAIEKDSSVIKSIQQ